MYDFMKKIPGGLLLVPMFLAAIVNTIAPDFFTNLGGISEALFTPQGINYVIGVACFCSGATLNLNTLLKVLRKQGSLLFVKTIICIAAGLLYIQFFGLDGIWGISAIALITTICSTNPSLYMALVQDYGTDEDVSAFGLVGLFCVPAYPMLVFSVAQQTSIDWTPIISTLIPIIFGMIVGNLDPKMAAFFRPGILVLTPFMGWVFGAGINLVSAVQAGPQGVVLSIVYILIQVPILFAFEKYILKESGVSAIAISSVAGMSVSVPALIVASNILYEPYLESATAQIAFAVVITSAITPIIARTIHVRRLKNA